MKKTIFVSVLMVGLGIIMGVFLISNFTPDFIQNILAKSNKDIGAAQSPIEMSNSAQIINEALTTASESVTSTVVFIDVVTKLSSDSQRGHSNEFFRFFGIPEEDRKQRGSGSGVFITDDGYIITNNHVIENADENGITVTTIDKKKHKAKLIGADPLTDLAIIKIEGSGFQPAHLGDISKVKVGEMVLAVGSPLGLNYTVTSGIVSAIGRGNFGMRTSSYSVENYIQTDAAINPGNSGGGLFDLNGSLIGINTAIATGTGSYIGYGFAIPVDLVKAVAEDLMDDGKISRGYIGVSIKSIDEVYAKTLGLDEVKGVLVESVLEDSPAEKAGIEIEDVILSVDDRETNTSSELQSIIATYRAGDKVNLTIWRNGKKLNKELALKSRDSEESLSENSQEIEEEVEEDSIGPVNFEKIGFEVSPIPEPMKEKMRIKNGALITKVERFSHAADRGLFPNGVIVRADRKEVKSPNDLKKIIESKSKGDVIMMQVKYLERNQIVALEIQ